LENWPSAQLEGDIRLVPAEEVPDHELLVGGFPCQCPGEDAKGILCVGIPVGAGRSPEKSARQVG